MKDLIRNAKRSMAFVLSLAMLLTGTSVTTFAAEVKEDEVIVETAETVTEPEEAVTEDAAEVKTEESAADTAVETVSDTTVTETVSEDDAVTETVSDDAVNEEETGVAYDDSILTGKNLKSDTALFNATLNKDGSVKLSWKGVKGVTKYTLERLSVGAGTESKELLSKSTKKSFTDKPFAEFKYDEGAGATTIYVLHQLDKNDAEVGIIAAIPSLYILGVQSEGDGSATVYVPDLIGPVDFKLERSTTSKFNDSTAIDISSSTVDLGNKFAGKYAIGLTDSEANLDDVKTLYYRVTPIIKKGDNEITAKASASASVKYAVAAPEINDVQGKYTGGSVTVDLTYCFKSDINEINKIQVIRTDAKGKTTTVASVQYDSLALEVIDKKVTIPVDKFYPGVAYSYRARVSYFAEDEKGKLKECYTEYGAPFDYLLSFEQVPGLGLTPVNQNKMKLEWYTDESATSYALYRSKKALENFGPEVSSVADLKWSDFKKIKTIINDESYLTYEDKTKLNYGCTYVYRVVPVNNKVYGYDKMAWSDAQTDVMGPTEVNVKSAGVDKLEVTWNASYKATKYIVERTNKFTDDDLEKPDFSTPEWTGEFDSKSTVFKKRKLTQTTTQTDKGKIVTNTPYAYRVMAVAKVNDVEVESAPADDAWGVDSAKPLKISSLKVTTDGCISDKGWSTKDTTHGVKIIFSSRADRNTVTGYKVTYHTDEESPATEQVISFKDSDKNTINYLPATDSKNKPIKNFTIKKDGLKRGVTYTFTVTPFYVPAGKDITNDSDRFYGEAKSKNFAMSSKLYIAPDKYQEDDNGDEIYEYTEKTPYKITKDKTKRFWIDTDVDDPSYEQYEVTIDDPKKFEAKVGKSGDYYYVDITSKTDKEKDKTYFTVKLLKSDDVRDGGIVGVVSHKFYICGD